MAVLENRSQKSVEELTRGHPFSEWVHAVSIHRTEALMAHKVERSSEMVLRRERASNARMIYALVTLVNEARVSRNMEPLELLPLEEHSVLGGREIVGRQQDMIDQRIAALRGQASWEVRARGRL